MSKHDELCGSRNTFDEEPCNNLKSACPFYAHTLPDVTNTNPVGKQKTPSDIFEEVVSPYETIENPAVSVELPGVVEGGLSFAGQVEEFNALARQVEIATGVSSRNLTRDYWLTKCLFDVRQTLGSQSIFKKQIGKDKIPLAVYVFSGGTSLVSGWQITERYSEDLDMMAFSVDDLPSRNDVARILSFITHQSAKAVGVEVKDMTVVTRRHSSFRTAHVPLGGDKRFLKIETAVEADRHELLGALYHPRVITSLMGRHATPQQLATFPELGGFEMLCTSLTYTAGNKFDALHRRAATTDLNGLVRRARDLYDLACIATSSHADTVRNGLPEIADYTAEPASKRQKVPRPDAGYSSSPIFSSGSLIQTVLKEGYEAMSDLVWGDFPDFETAIDLAASLD